MKGVAALTSSLDVDGLWKTAMKGEGTIILLLFRKRKTSCSASELGLYIGVTTIFPWVGLMITVLMSVSGMLSINHPSSALESMPPFSSVALAANDSWSASIFIEYLSLF